MVESEATGLSEEIMLGAVMFGHKACQEVIDLIIELAEACAKEPRDIPPESPEVEKVTAKLKKSITKDLQKAYKVADKVKRQELIAVAKEKGMQLFVTEEESNAAKGALKSLEADIVRGSILDTGVRIDGRDTKTVRPIVSEVGILPRAHGSALFTRGETQALVVTTLGTGQDEQIIDALEGEYRENFMLHYNSPPPSLPASPTEYGGKL